jgi:hypothetical protein
MGWDYRKVVRRKDHQKLAQAQALLSKKNIQTRAMKRGLELEPEARLVDHSSCCSALTVRLVDHSSCCSALTVRLVDHSSCCSALTVRLADHSSCCSVLTVQPSLRT